ncbi:unnamed protein product, partial [Laminaria digitata]
GATAAGSALGTSVGATGRAVGRAAQPGSWNGSAGGGRGGGGGLRSRLLFSSLPSVASASAHYDLAADPRPSNARSLPQS